MSKIDYSIKTLRKNGGKITGCIGFPGAIWDLYYNGQNLDLKENNYEVQEKISKFEGCTSLVG